MTPSNSSVPEALARLEADLEQEWQDLSSRGQGYAALHALLLDGKGVSAEGGDRLRDACAAQAEFLQRLDEFQRVKQVYFMQAVTGDLAQAIARMESFYGRKLPRSLAREARRLRGLEERYRALESLWGTQGDHRRIAVFQDFYAGVIEFSSRIRALDPTAPLPPRPGLLDRLEQLQRGLKRMASRLGDLLGLIAAAFGILVALFGPRPTRGTPLTRNVNRLFARLGALRGLSVEVEEEVPLGEFSGLTLYAPTHRNGVLDNIVFASLGPSDYLVFNAVDQLPGLPRRLRDRAAETPGLIAVGPGRGSSIDRLLGALAAGVSRNVLIYPEGSVSEGFGGTRPPRERFADGLVRTLRERDMPLRIVPIAYLDNARFLDLPPRGNDPGARRLRAGVGPALDASMIDRLLALGGGAFLSQMLRLAWLERLVTDSTTLLGAERLSEIWRRLDLELEGIRYWGALVPATVADTLPLAGGVVPQLHEEIFHGKRVRVFRIPDEAIDADGRVPLPSLASEGSNELILGVRAPSHIYLNLGRQRFDGDILRPLRVRERDYAYPGILIRFVDVPVKSLHQTRRTLEWLSGRERRTLTCAHSACVLIGKGASLRIDDASGPRSFLPSHVLPTRTIRKLIEYGVRDHRGRALPLEIHATGQEALEDMLARMRREEVRILADHFRLITTGALERTWKWLRRGCKPPADPGDLP
jgi:1-acyl-sn-glycerol-3-phosphate acyltransferase